MAGFLAMGIAGSEVRVGEKLEDFEANPMVVLEGAGAACGAPATESSGRRRRSEGLGQR